MPAFNSDNQPRIILGAGELFCCVSIDGGATLCIGCELGQVWLFLASRSASATMSRGCVGYLAPKWLDLTNVPLIVR
ncbi:hypothetical protein F4782DRAFT_517645 [Xylaria castorea]|nr:hypothetical protein F4782DRAFT_517645 [Xylaria castorea]